MIMKRNLLVLILALMTSMPMTAADYDANGNLLINENNFPDPVFREWLLTNTGAGGYGYGNLGGMKGYGTDGIFTPSELADIFNLRFENLGIKNLKGIEFFTNINALYCYKVPLEGTLDLSKNTRINTIFIGNQTDNNLENLNLSNLTNIRKLVLRCPLTSLDVSDLIYLEDCELSGCENISAVDFSSCTRLVRLEIYSGSKALINSVVNTVNTESLLRLHISSSRCTYLDLSDFSSLMDLDISSNKDLISYTLPTNTANLKYLYIANNEKITSIDVSKYTSLIRFCCPNNKLTSLDVSKNTALLSLQCYRNNLTELDLSQNTELRVLIANNNDLTELDLSNNTKLKWLQLHYNHLTELDLSNNSEMEIQYVASEWDDDTGDDDLIWHILDTTYGEGQGQTGVSPQTLSKDYVAIDGRSKIGIQCNTNDGNLANYGIYANEGMYTDDEGNNFIVIADEENGKTDIHGYDATQNGGYKTESYVYETGAIAKKTHSWETGDRPVLMTVNIQTAAHGMYVHPETLRGSDNFYSGTLYLEFPAKIPEGVRCYYATGLDDNEDLVGLTEVTGTIPANTAVIVKAPTEYKFFAFNKSDETPDAPTNNIIEGTIEGLSVTPGTVLTLGHNVDRSTGEYDNFGFWNYRGNQISPFRAYIPKSNLASGAKNGFSLFFPENGTTGIARMANSNAAEEGAWYTLSGVRLNGKPTEKGIYVNNGKKTVIR